jgi:hypothetical protein
VSWLHAAAARQQGSALILQLCIHLHIFLFFSLLSLSLSLHFTLLQPAVYQRTAVDIDRRIGSSIHEHDTKLN